MKTGTIIIGAGIVGSAVAYELALRGQKDVVVIDPDLEGELSSSERNAGGVRHLWQNPVNSELARHTIALFEKIKDEIGFQQTGYLWLYSHDDADKAEVTHSGVKRLGLEYEKLSVSEIKNRYPFLDKTEDIGVALFGAKDGLINSNALKLYFRTEAKKRGVKFIDAAVALELKEEAKGVSVPVARYENAETAKQFLRDPQTIKNSPSESWFADRVILCAGAWTYLLTEKLVSYPEIRPVRRQISLFKAEGFDMTPYGMVVDTSRVYFHPEGGNILAGYVIKEESPGFHFELDSDFFESHIWPALYERSSHMERLKPLGGWGGLYSYTPDTTGILGRLPKHQHIFEAHSFTGRGVMQSYGAALALCDLILLGKFENFDASQLARERFLKPQLEWLFEGLHI